MLLFINAKIFNDRSVNDETNNEFGTGDDCDAIKENGKTMNYI